jgi:hypothetical protein
VETYAARTFIAEDVRAQPPGFLVTVTGTNPQCGGKLGSPGKDGSNSSDRSVGAPPRSIQRTQSLISAVTQSSPPASRSIVGAMGR